MLSSFVLLYIVRINIFSCIRAIVIVIVINQKISELDDHQIVIMAKRGSVTEKYIIHVKINDKKNIEIDKGEFVEDKSYKKKWLVIIIGLNAILLFSLVFIKIKRNG